MQIGKFRQIMDPLKAKVATLDALVKEGGQHFNEDQAAKAFQLTAEIYATAGQAASEAQQFFAVESAEDNLNAEIDAAEPVADPPTITVISVTITSMTPADTGEAAHAAAMAAPINEDHPVTAGAIASMQQNAPTPANSSPANPANSSNVDTAALLTQGEHSSQTDVTSEQSPDTGVSSSTVAQAEDSKSQADPEPVPVSAAVNTDPPAASVVIDPPPGTDGPIALVTNTPNEVAAEAVQDVKDNAPA